MDGFTVDVDALTAAGQGIKDVMSKLDQMSVEDIDCDSDSVGHSGLADRLESFCGRWQIGVENLLEDGAQIAQRLLDSAEAYRGHDNAIAKVLSGGVDGG